MPKLAPVQHGDVLPRDHNFAMAQCGWLGHSGEVYQLDDPPFDDREPAGFGPIYIALGVWEDLGDGKFGITD